MIAKQFLAWIAVAGLLAGGAAAEEVAYHQNADGETRGYLALPEGATAGAGLPALILIHEWWGLNDDIRAKAREFAAAGYAALAVDLYSGQTASDPDGARKLASAVRENPEAAFENLGAAAAYLRSLPETDEARLGSVGWCFGGGWSYQIAKNDLGAKASVIYYGRFNADDDLEHMRATIIGHFGENDRAIPADSAREFRARLESAGGAHEIYIYPGAGHGFANPDNPSFNEDAARTAAERTLDFLSRNL